MNWTETAFWGCSWTGFHDAWTGYCAHVLGHDPDNVPMTRAEALALDHALAAWQNQGA